MRQIVNLAVLLTALFWGVGVFGPGCTKTASTGVYSLDQNMVEKECIAIFPFDNLTNYPNAGRIVADLMATSFFRSQKFRIMERSEIERITSLSQINLPRKVSPQFARVMGEVLEVDAVLIGSVTEYAYLDPATGNPGVSLSANLVDVETGKSLWIGSHTRTSKDHVQYKKDPVNRIALITVDKVTSPFFKQIPSRQINHGLVCGNSLAIIPPPITKSEDKAGLDLGTLAGRTVRASGTGLGSVILDFPNRDLSRILTDPETGSFKMDNLPPGSLQILASRDGFVPQTVDAEVKAGKMTVIDVKMVAAVQKRKKRIGTITGKVLDTGGKAVGATIFVRSSNRRVDLNVKTKKDGSFRMKVPPGSYEVRVISGGFVTQTKKIRVENKAKVILNINMHTEREF